MDPKEPTKGSAQPEETSVSEEKNQTKDVRDPEAVLRKNQELLNEKRRVLQEREDLERKLKEYEQRELEKQGNYEEALKREREERIKLEQKYKDSTQKYAYSTVVNQIKQKALQEGCKDPDKLIRLASDADMDLVQYDDEYRVDYESLSVFVDKMKRENDFLFKPRTNAPRDIVPGSSPSDFRPKEVDVKTADRKTLSSLYASLRAKELEQGR